jgi:hypothetical protein
MPGYSHKPLTGQRPGDGKRLRVASFSRLLKKPFFVGDDVRRLKFLWKD